MSDAPNRIRELRLQADMSQQALGDAIGTSKMTISDLERGKMRLDLEYMRRIAQALDVTVADLLPRADNPNALDLSERRLIDRLRHASDEQREQLHRVADVIVPWASEEPATERLAPRRAAR